MRLGSLLGHYQAQLDGFKTRALKVGVAAAAPHRHLYATEWRVVGKMEHTPDMTVLVCSDVVASAEAGCSCLWVAAANHCEGCALSAVVMAPSNRHVLAIPLFELEAALAIVQMVSVTSFSSAVWLLTIDAPPVQRLEQASSSLRPGFAGAWGLSRTARAEASIMVRCCAMEGTTLSVGTLHSEPEVALHAEVECVPRLATTPPLAFLKRTLDVNAHLVTGGTAGLGLLTARWLAGRGVSALSLASRRGVAAQDDTPEWTQLQLAHVLMLLQSCNTAEVAHAQLLLLTRGKLPIVGAWHAAGVLADGTLPAQRGGAFGLVYAPKAHSGWALQLATASSPLHAFAFFSSVAALLGGAGQANYSAANACLDALASFRLTSSLPAVSVPWGAWAEMGMAARGAGEQTSGSIGHVRLWAG